MREDFYRFSPYEWVLSNARGGYALGEANLLNQRKYHGLLIASDSNFKRTHLVSSVEEKIEINAGISFFLDSNNYSNVVYPQGYNHMVKYYLRPFPSFLYSTIPSTPEILLLKTIQLHPDLNYAVVKYKNLGKVPLRLILRPKFTLRDHHSVHQTGYWDSVYHDIKIEQKLGSLSVEGINAHVFASKGDIFSEPLIYRSVVYPTEIIRGYEAVEDLLAPFRINVELKAGEEQVLIFGDKVAEDFDKICFEASKRYQAYPLPSNYPSGIKSKPEKILRKATASEKAFGYEEYIKILKLAATEFVANDDLIAGFPWFSAWGRDTMISLEALKYFDGGLDLAFRILKKYGENMRDGIIPNTIGEGRVGSNYDTVDASLWFGLRILEYYDQFDQDIRSELYAFVAKVIAHYLMNPALHFHIDTEDGLITIHSHTNCALTWMDAKVSEEPVSPRYGKPIEINALWYDLLHAFLQKAEREGLEEVSFEEKNIPVSKLETLARKAKKTLKSFYKDGAFADRIEDGNLIMELRPNYIIALSLPANIFNKEEMKAGYQLAKDKLLTPYGLRSLSPDHPAFRKRYMGNQRTRDLAYHQGTVWVWLLLPLAKVAAKIFSQNKNVLSEELREVVSSFREGIMQGEMASIPELYEGAEPYLPKGAPAQCWSVAAVFIIEKMIENLGVDI
jgi:predicted glycogen debranching enzyme